MVHAWAHGRVALLSLSLLFEAVPPAAVAADSDWPPATASSSGLAESDGTTYLYGRDLLAIDRSGTTSWYLPDGLGSTRRVTDAAGTIVAGYEYEAFGKLRGATGSLANEVRFSGERTDPEVGLLFLRARHYDPDTGRFLQADKWPSDERLSQDLNRYAYVRNDPANRVDPSGHFGWLETPLDIASFAMSVAEFVQRPSVATAAWVIADAAAVVLPIPGVGTIRRTAGALGDVLSAGRRVENAVQAGAQTTRAAVNSSRTATRTAFGVATGPSVASGAARGSRAAASGSDATRFVRNSDTPSVRTAQAGRAASMPGPTSGGDQIFRHYTDDVGRAGIERSGVIRPGVGGRVYVTPTRYTSGTQAQAELALGRTPTGYFEIPEPRLPGLQGPRQVQPWGGQPGGGIECWVTCPVDAEGLKWVPIEP